MSGSGYCPDSKVDLTLRGADGSAAGESARTDSDGSFSESLLVPQQTAPGDYTLRGSGKGADCSEEKSDSADLRVRDEDSEAGAGGAGTSGTGAPSEVEPQPSQENRPSPLMLYVAGAAAAMAFGFYRLVLN